MRIETGRRDASSAAMLVSNWVIRRLRTNSVRRRRTFARSLDARYHHISTVEITKGSINESLAYPRDIFRPVIGRLAFAFVLAHNHPSGEPTPSEADIRLTRRLVEGARILQVNMVDHVIVGQSFDGWPGY